MHSIDVLIMGSSRPFLLQYLIESLHTYVLNLSNSKIRILLHEDFIIEEQSKRSLDMARQWGFEVVHYYNPGIGLGYSMDYMFRNYITADYILYLQDDFEFERPIELDRVLWTMNKWENINLVNFSHYKNVRETDFESKEYDFDGLKMCGYNGWTFTPGVWRMSKVREKWEAVKVRPEGHFTNQFGTHKERLDQIYCYDNLGVFHYGGMGEPRYVRHLGSTWRMADWRMKDGKPNGTLHWEFQSLKRDRAPWLNNLPERPINPDIKLTEEGKRHLEKQDDYIKERFK